MSSERILPKILEMKIEEFDFSIRTEKALKSSKISNVKELISKTKPEILSLRNLGQKGYEEIVQKLQTLGLSLRKTDNF